MWTFYLYAFSVILLSVKGNFIDLGACPSQTVQQNFNFEQYMGRWFQIARYNAVFEGNGKCTFGEYKSKNSYTMDVHYEQINKDTGNIVGMDGSEELIDPSADEGKLSLTLYVNSHYNVTGSQWVLNTDYENYAIVYSCKTLFWAFHQTNCLIFTRTRSPSPDTLRDINQLLKQHKMNFDDFTPTDQSDCN